MAFLTSESGAVTVDWVVLTAGVVGLGMATIATVSTGVNSSVGGISDAMDAQRVMNALQLNVQDFWAGDQTGEHLTGLDLPERFGITATVDFNTLNDGNFGDWPLRLWLGQDDQGVSEGRLERLYVAQGRDGNAVIMLDSFDENGNRTFSSSSRITGLITAGESAELTLTLDENDNAVLYKNGQSVLEYQVNLSPTTTRENSRLYPGTGTGGQASDGTVSDIRISSF